MQVQWHCEMGTELGVGGGGGGGVGGEKWGQGGEGMREGDQRGYESSGLDNQLSSAALQ